MKRMSQDARGDRRQIRMVIDLSDKFILKEVNDFRGRPVFIVIDPETKEVLDDANGQGYATRPKANVAYKYKLKKKLKTRIDDV